MNSNLKVIADADRGGFTVTVMNRFKQTEELKNFRTKEEALTHANTVVRPNLSVGGWKAVQDIKKGEFVRRKQDANQTYTREDYDRTYGYQLDDYDDISRCIYVKKNTLLWVDFLY